MAGKGDLEGNILPVNRRVVLSGTEDELNQCLPGLLECPVCFECMQPPIRLCRNGHNICSKCRPRLNNCPTCRQSILVTRNFALESLAEHCLESCGNSDVGCEVKKVTIQEVINHMEICSYRLYDCEPGRAIGCAWLGRRWQLLNHVQDIHKNTLILSESNSCKIKNFHNFDHGLTTQVIIAFGELFWFHHEKDSSKDKFYGAVQYVGPEENAAKFHYEFKFSSTNSSKMEVSFSRNTHRDTKLIDDIFNEEECLCVSLKLMKNFVCSDGVLRFRLDVKVNE